MRTERGYVLIVVLGALALIAIVAARFAQRLDGLREQVLSMKTYAQQRLDQHSALAAALYVVTTRPPGPGGFGSIARPDLWADGRNYHFPSGAQVSIQDQRGLFSLASFERSDLERLLRSLGAEAGSTDALIDVLLDYQDTDSLKRLNGAEAPDYASAGLPPPRNDWLISSRELERMPLWRDRPELLRKLDRLASIRRGAEVNINTAPKELLGVILPQARPDQVERLDAWRRQIPFVTAAAAQEAAGLVIASEAYAFHVGDQFLLRVAAAGAPRALQYNLQLAPDGRDAPWTIFEAHPVVNSKTAAVRPERATPFPLELRPN